MPHSEPQIETAERIASAGYYVVRDTEAATAWHWETLLPLVGQTLDAEEA